MTAGRGRTIWLAAAFAAVSTVVAPVPAGAAPEAGDEWDPRIEAIAEEVADLRGLEFEEPVEALFLGDKAFRKRVTSEEDDLTKSDKFDLRFSEAELRALGLVGGDIDLFATVNEEVGSGVVAYYNPDNGRIVIRGKRLDPFTKVSVAHELTHALQDQHFDLAALDEQAADSSGATEAVTALVEGDATRIELEYLDTLDDDEQDRYWEQAETFGTDPDEPVLDEPVDASSALAGATFDAPYALGPSMVSILEVDGGNRRVDRAFRHPPTTQRQILDPLTVLDRAPEATVRPPRRPEGTKAAWPDDLPHDLGALDVFFLLASRLPALDALAAADDVKAGAANAYRDDGALCFDVAFRTFDESGAARLSGALKMWAAAMPPGAVTQRANGLGFRVCDPGDAAAAPPNSVLDALTFVSGRSDIEWALYDSGLDAEETECVAGGVVTTPEFAKIVSAQNAGEEPADADYEAIWDVVDDATEACIDD
ncbi:MAG: hypothetical protein FJW88_02120 [Actinobacteria bacterium]|nr:hypothetical protein [Actinomycetota bacterium]